MLGFDQPVGTGYSYTKSDAGYVNNEHEMAEQLFNAMKGFFDRHPQYSENPGELE